MASTLNTISLSGSLGDSNIISEALILLVKLSLSLNSISPSPSVLIFVPLKSIVLPARNISLNLKAVLPILNVVVWDGNISPETLILFALKPPLADKSPVTLKPDNSNPISKLVADNRLVASMLLAIIVLLLLIKFVVVLPLSVTSCKLIEVSELKISIKLFE